MSSSATMVEGQQQQQPRIRGGISVTNTARSEVVKGTSSTHTAASDRPQLRETEIQQHSDVITVIQKWLGRQDSAIIKLAEKKIGLDREKLFYALCGIIALYLICGPGNGLLCNLIGFAYPAYQSIHAINNENNYDLTHWLIYWTVFGIFSLFDIFAVRIRIPFYWLGKAIFLLYLATMGTHNMYVRIFLDKSNKTSKNNSDETINNHGNETGNNFGKTINNTIDNKNNNNIDLNQSTPMTTVQIPPGDIITLPNMKVVFNAPFEDRQTYHIRLINASTQRINFTFRTTNLQRLNIDPPYGVLNGKQSANIAISCEAFNPSVETVRNDRVTVMWTNAAEGAANTKQFIRESFKGDVMVRRKNLPIEYNM